MNSDLKYKKIEAPAASTPANLLGRLRRRPKGAVFLFFFVLIVLFWRNALQGDFHFDDFSNIVNNPAVHVSSLSYDELRDAAAFRGISNRPLAYVSFAVNHYFHGFDAQGYLLVNLAVHGVTAWFLFLFIAGTLRLPSLHRQYGERAVTIAALAALLWLVHPLHASTLTYIVQRMAGMAA